jgi:hypothetical protein
MFSVQLHIEQENCLLWMTGKSQALENFLSSSLTKQHIQIKIKQNYIKKLI